MLVRPLSFSLVQVRQLDQKYEAFMEAQRQATSAQRKVNSEGFILCSLRISNTQKYFISATHTIDQFTYP